MVIQGTADLLLDDDDVPTSSHADISQILACAERGAALTNQLLSFSRRQLLEQLPVDLDELAASVLELCERVLGEHIETELIRAAPPQISGDAGQLEQALLNLCLNARDAMPNGGRLRLETGVISADERFCLRRAWAAPGRYATLAVIDAGIGMDAETRLRVFEPFFSTKDPGRGTGLGLATVYGIAEQHGGAIEVESQPGKGSRFTLYLPVPDGEADSEAVLRRVSLGHPPVQGHQDQTILVVEDDLSVRGLIERVLSRAGYAVLTAAHPDEAMALVDHGAAPDLALIDLVMPRGGGRDLGRQLHELLPALKVVFCTGYSAETRLPDKDDHPPLLRKPITPRALLREVQRALND
jgi:two-component system cell cycle sensor histidine kinase/response regulator CckA